MPEDPLDELSRMAKRAARPDGPTWEDAHDIAYRTMVEALPTIPLPLALQGDVIEEPYLVVLYVILEGHTPSVTIRYAGGGGRAEFVYGEMLEMPSASGRYVLGPQEEPSPLRLDQVTRETVLEIVKFWAGLRVFS